MALSGRSEIVLSIELEDALSYPDRDEVSRVEMDDSRLEGSREEA
jgi:hypothetical protein